MHEMSLMQGLLQTAETALASYSVRQVNALHVQAGLLANLLPNAFIFAFETLAQGTVFENAELKVEKMPLQAHCCNCKKEYASMDIPPQCPHCTADEYEIIGGTEVVLSSIDFEEI